VCSVIGYPSRARRVNCRSTINPTEALTPTRRRYARPHKLASWLEQVKDEGGKKPENVEGLRGQDYPYHEFSKKNNPKE
jgi:hypothetical protein